VSGYLVVSGTIRVEDAQPHVRPPSKSVASKVPAKPDPVAGFGPPASASPVWELTQADPKSEAEVCRSRAEAARSLAQKAMDPVAREALEVVAANWDRLGDHLAERPHRRRRIAESSRKAEARRAALGIEG
jgi:hypothetical protein